MRNRALLAILLFLCIARAYAQDNFSASFFYFHRNIHLHLPSSVCRENDLQGTLAYKNYVGKLSVIRTYYADVNFNLRKKENAVPEKSKHIVGLGFYNDREGDFFSKARILGRYAVHIPVGENLFLSSGASFHLINYNFHASGQGAAGSAMTWSGGISTSLYSPGFIVGIALNDFNSPSLRPIGYTFTIDRYLTVYADKLFRLSENVQFRGAGKFNRAQSASSFIAHAGFVFSETVGISGLHYVGRGSGLAIDLNQVKLYKGFVDFSLAYLAPGKNVNPSVGQYELNLIYYMDK